MKYFQYTLSIFVGLFFVTGLSAQNVWIKDIQSNVSGLEAHLLEQKLNASLANEACFCYLNVVVNEGTQERMQSLDNQTIVTADMDVTIFNALDGSVLETKYLVLSGSGTSVHAAQKALLNNVRKKSKSIRKALKTVSAKMGQPTCSRLNTASDLMLSERDYTSAFRLSKALTQQCGDEYLDVRRKIYNAYQDDHCARHLTNAKSYIATNNFKAARAEIMNVAPESTCGSEISDLIETLSKDQDQQEDRAFQTYMRLVEQQIQSDSSRDQLIELLLLNKVVND